MRHVAVHDLRHLVFDAKFQLLQHCFFLQFIIRGVSLRFEVLNTLLILRVPLGQGSELIVGLHQARFQFFLRDLHRQSCLLPEIPRRVDCPVSG